MTDIEKRLNDPSFNPGGLESRKDPRNFQWDNLGAALPPFNWEQGYDIESVLASKFGAKDFKLPVKDQGSSGSCGGQETSSYVGVLEGVSTSSFEERSAKDVISQTFILGSSDQMLGSNFDDNSKLTVSTGVCREIILPSYDHGKPPTDAFMNRPQDITEAAREDAKLTKNKSYAFVNTDIDSIAQSIGANYGTGLLLYGSNNGTWLSAYPKPGAQQWGHFVYAGKARLMNGKKFVGILQSWGKTVGELGWQWLGEDYFASGNVREARTFVFNDTAPTPKKYLFTRDLTLGSTGIDVKFLQVFLNAHNCPVATRGEGSPGNETSYFGVLTRDAVAKFQKDNKISPAVGYFGTLTRAKINSMQ